MENDKLHIPKPSETSVIRGTRALDMGKGEVRRLSMEMCVWRVEQIRKELDIVAGELEQLRNKK